MVIFGALARIYLRSIVIHYGLYFRYVNCKRMYDHACMWKIICVIMIYKCDYKHSMHLFMHLESSWYVHVYVKVRLRHASRCQARRRWIRSRVGNLCDSKAGCALGCPGKIDETKSTMSAASSWQPACEDMSRLMSSKICLAELDIDSVHIQQSSSRQTQSNYGTIPGILPMRGCHAIRRHQGNKYIQAPYT